MFAAVAGRRALILEQVVSSGSEAASADAASLLRDDIDAVLALVDAAGDLALFVSRHTPAARAALTGAMRTLMQAIAPMDAEAARERMRASLAAADAAAASAAQRIAALQAATPAAAVDFGGAAAAAAAGGAALAVASVELAGLMEEAVFRCGDFPLARELLAAARAAQARAAGLRRERQRLVRAALAELAPTLEAARQLAANTALSLGADAASEAAVAAADALGARCVAAQAALRRALGGGGELPPPSEAAAAAAAAAAASSKSLKRGGGQAGGGVVAPARLDAPGRLVHLPAGRVPHPALCGPRAVGRRVAGAAAGLAGRAAGAVAAAGAARAVAAFERGRGGGSICCACSSCRLRTVRRDVGQADGVHALPRGQLLLGQVPEAALPGAQGGL